MRMYVRIVLPLMLLAALTAGLLVWIKRPAARPVQPLHSVVSVPRRVPAPPAAGVNRPPAPKRGDRVGRIEVPRLKLAVNVYEGDDAAILDEGAGHVPGTALPGAAGNICIAAHRDKFFRALRFIKPRDEIVLETEKGLIRFTVNSTTIVKPSDVQELMPAPHRDLTLVTCYPFFYVGSAPRRFIVHASREDANRG